MMMSTQMLIDSIFFLSAIFYFLVHAGLVTGIRRISSKINTDKPFVSVIVAVRNEELTLSRLLECLSRQTYSNYELILINDRSTDNTRNIITEAQKKNQDLKCIDITALSDDMPAKKNALRSGIDKSKGEIICLTDGDCFPPFNWIENIVEKFEPEVGIVAGYSPYQVTLDEHQPILKKLLQNFIAYEEIRAAGWASGSIGLNLGWLCTGRNLAYRRIVYDEMNGFERIKTSVSGDDDLFLQAVRKYSNWKISYSLSDKTFIPTLPPSSFKSFVEQRKRHFSATKYFSTNMKIFFTFYHSSNLFLLLSPVFCLFKLVSFEMFIFSILVKLFCDTFLFYCLARKFNGTNFFNSFILMEVLYVPYNIIIGLIGLFGKFEWKKI